MHKHNINYNFCLLSIFYNEYAFLNLHFFVDKNHLKKYNIYKTDIIIAPLKKIF